MTAKILYIAVLAVGVIMFVNVSPATAQINSTRASVRQTQKLITRIETKIEVMKDELQRVSARPNRSEPGTASVSDLDHYLDDLTASMTRVDDAFDARQPVDNEVRAALSDATTVDQFMVQNRLNATVEAQWRSLKRDFDTLATYNRLSWDWNRPIDTRRPPIGRPPTGGRAYVVSDAEMQTLLSRIALKTENFKRQMDLALPRVRNADTASVTRYISGFETATNRLRQRFDSRESTDEDVNDVLLRAGYIDQFMGQNTLSTEAEAQWRNLRADLNTLATDYRVSWNWNQTLPPYPGETGRGGGRNFDAALTGTYRLNTALSENVANAVDRALGSSNVTADRPAEQERLLRRLQSPDMIAIEKIGQQVKMASSTQPQVSFQADGLARSETNQRGRTITTTVTADTDGLIVNYQGERASDFYVTFTPTADGHLRVTRRIYLDNGTDSVTVASVYDKIDNVARWNMVTAGGDTSAGVVNDSFIIPNGTRLNAVLRTPINSGGMQTNDRVTLEVTTPSQYRGAVISGRIITEDPSSRLPGRTRVLLNFDTVRMPNGQTYRFTGLVNGVTDISGDNVGVAQQTSARSTRAGVGDVLGALIGAISGRPIEQATTGQPLGTILSKSGDVLTIDRGSQFVITSTANTTIGQFRSF